MYAASLAAWSAAEQVTPRTNEQALNIWRTQVRRLPAYRITRESDIWYRASGNRFIHISLIEAQSGLIRGISIFDLSPEFDLVQRADAREATWAAGGWTLHEGYRLELEQQPVRIEPFRQMGVSLTE